MTCRIINRVIVYDQVHQRILLVKNSNAEFWYAPGGEWESESETIQAGAEREVLEETGIRASIQRLLYVRPFRPPRMSVQLELYWLASTLSVKLPMQHQDRHGLVETARWFCKTELRGLSVFPQQLKTAFWADLKATRHNPFLRE